MQIDPGGTASDIMNWLQALPVRGHGDTSIGRIAAERA
jgi:hypothetical protein